MDLKILWQAILGELEVTLSQASFTTWFKDSFIYDFEDGMMIIAVPDSFHKEWLENKFNAEIFKTIQKHCPKKVKQVKYKIAVRKPVPTITAEAAAINSRSDTSDVFLNPYYTFDKFVVGSSNRLAHAAALAVATKPGTSYNPLFLYGGVGLGKTHLMQAIGNNLLRQSGLRVVYAPCEKFTNEYIRSIQTGKVNKFKEKYRNIDALLIDDVQFLIGKESTKEEFFHTFNALHQKNKQIVVSSDRPPKALSALEDRLISRFEGGMTADISPPDFETRLSILKQKEKEKNYSLSDDVLEFIASKVETNIRELEGTLTRLVATSQLAGEKPTLERAQQILSSFEKPKNDHLTIDKIITCVAQFYNIDKEDIINKKRDKELVHPRQIVMHLIRHELSHSYPKIGKELKRDHTTVMHGCKKIERNVVQNSNLKQEISLIKNKLYNE